MKELRRKGKNMAWSSPLRKHRETHGWTVEELADKAGCSPSILYQRERSKLGFPRLDTARAIARALGVSIDELWPEV